MRSVRLGHAAAVLVLAVTSCSSGEGSSPRRTTGGQATVDVVASAYPLAFVAERVGGSRVSVSNLTPPGVEPHDLEIDPDDVERLEDADLVLVIGGQFQPSIESIAKKRKSGVVDVIATQPSGKARDIDPHIWLDPSLMAEVSDETQRALAAVDSAGAETYRANAAALRSELDGLDNRYKTGLAGCAQNTIISSHDAFGRLADRYGLDHEGIAGLTPESEPDADRIAQLADLVERTGVRTIFTETLVPRDLAETLAREAGVRVEVLDPLEGLDDDDIAAGEDYFTVMDANLQTLRAALGCGEAKPVR